MSMTDDVSLDHFIDQDYRLLCIITYHVSPPFSASKSRPNNTSTECVLTAPLILILLSNEYDCKGRRMNNRKSTFTHTRCFTWISGLSDTALNTGVWQT